MKNKISIITIVKNDQENILNTINSVLSQKRCKFEYIVLDGFSTDGTSKKIKNLKKKKYKSFKYFKYKDLNLYDGINKAIKKSSGKYIFLIHSGDIFKNNLIISKISKCLNKNPDVVSGNLLYYKMLNGKKVIKRIWRHPIKNINKFSIFKIPHTTMLIKKEVLRKLNYYDIRYNISSDLDLLLKLNRLKNIKYIFIDRYFIFMKYGGISTSKNKFLIKFYQDLKILIKNYNILFIFIYFFKIYFKLFDFNKKNFK